MLRGCLAAAGTGSICVVEGIMNSEGYQQILDENVNQSSRKLSLGRRFLFLQDNDPKHTSKSTTIFFSNRRMKVMKWHSQNTKLNPKEHLWKELKSRVHKRRSSNIVELKAFAVKGWSNIATETCETMHVKWKQR